MTDREKQLEYIVRETLWMARRYADGRRTYAASTVNEAIQLAQKCGIVVEPDGATGKTFADDGDFGKWNPDTQKFEKE